MKQTIAIISFCFLLLSCGGTKDLGERKLSYSKHKQFEKAYFEAAKQKALGNNEKAIEYFQKALAIDPTSHETMYQMANLNFAMNNLTEAIKWAEYSVKANKDFNYWYYGQLAQFYNKASLFEESAKIFETMINADPGNAQNYLEAANQHLNNQDPKAALRVLDKLEEQIGVTEGGVMRKEHIYHKMGEHQLAIAEVKKLVSANPDEIRYQGMLAENLAKAGQFDEAIAAFQKVLTIEPGNGFAAFGLADIYRKNNDQNNMLKYMNLAFGDARIPISQKVNVMAGVFDEMLKNPTITKDVQKLAETMIEAHPQESPPYIVYADVLLSQNKTAKARTALIESLDVNNSDYRVWQKVFEIDEQLDNFNFMRDDTEKALTLFPNIVYLYILNGYSNLMLEEYEKVEGITLDGLELASKSIDKAQLINNLSDAYYGMKDFEKCFETFETLLKLNPGDVSAKNNFAYYLAEQNTNLEKAKRLSKEACNKEPNNPAFIDTYAWILHKSGESEQALVEINKAISLNENNSEYYRHKASILKALGKNEMSNEMLNKAILLDGK